MLDFWKAQAVEAGDGTRPHGENVTHDATYSGGRALVGFDRTGVIVTLDLESDRQTVTCIHQSGVLFTRIHQQFAP